MIKITKEIKLKNVTNIVTEKSPSFSGIVNQESKGNLWVNNLEMPTIAIAESFAVGGFAFLGNDENKESFSDLHNFLENELFYQLKKKGYDSFEFSVEGQQIGKNILDIFREKSIETEKEFSFRCFVAPMNSQSIPKGYHIKKVDNIFWGQLLDGKFTNEDFIKIRLLESWHSFEDFVGKSLAYCVIFDHRIVAVLVGTGSYNKVVAMDIETEEDHRKMGLAYAMGLEFIKEALKNDYIPQWDCVESNMNSCNLARKLGFELVGENTVYWFHI